MNALLIIQSQRQNSLTEPGSLRNIFYAKPLALLPIVNKSLLGYYLDFFRLLNIQNVRIVSNGSQGAIRKFTQDNYELGGYPEISFSLLSEGDSLGKILQKNRGFLEGAEALFFSGYAFLLPNAVSLPALRRKVFSMGNFYRYGSFHFGKIKKISTAATLAYTELARKKGVQNSRKKFLFTIHPLDTLKQYHSLNMHLLRQENKNVVLPGFQNDKGIRTGSHLVMRNQAHVKPAVHIGNSVVLENSVEIGNEAVIGDRVYIDAHTTVENSIIFADSYVGKWLHIKNAVLYKQRLYNVEKDHFVDLDDNLWAYDFSRDSKKRSLLSYGLAFIFSLLVLVLQSPMYWLYQFFSVRLISIERDSKKVYINDDFQVTEYWRYHFEDGRMLSRKIFSLFLLDKRRELKDGLFGRLALGGNSALEVSIEARSAIDAMPCYRPAIFGYSEAFGNKQKGREEKMFTELFFASKHSLWIELYITFRSLLRRVYNFL